MQRFTPRTLFSTLALVTALTVTGCVADPEVADVLPDQGSIPTHVAAVSFPDTEAGQTSAWVVDEINGMRSINKQDWYPRVSPELTDDIPVDSLVGTLNAQLRPSLPYVPSDYHEPAANYGVTRLSPDLTAEPVDLHVQVDDSGRISALWYETTNDGDSNTGDETPEETEEPADGLGN